MPVLAGFKGVRVGVDGFETGFMTLPGADETFLVVAPSAWPRVIKRIRSIALLSLFTVLFLLAPAMQGIGLTADSSGQQPTELATALDHEARAAVERLAKRP